MKDIIPVSKFLKFLENRVFGDLLILKCEDDRRKYGPQCVKFPW